MFEALFIPPLAILFLSFLDVTRIKRFLPIVSATIFIPVGLLLFTEQHHYYHNLIFVDRLAKFVLLVSSIVSIGVTLALESLQNHVKIGLQEYKRFYRFFALFWIGMIIGVTANSMGIFWVGLELATLSTVYMIKTNKTVFAHREAWNYMIVGTIAIALILFGIILIYASAKPVLHEDAMLFSSLLAHIHTIKNRYLFEIGFAFVAAGSFIKMGFFSDESLAGQHRKSCILSSGRTL